MDLLKKFISGIKCYIVLLEINVKTSMSYVLDAWIDMIVFAVHQIVSLIFIWVIFTKISDIGGWNLYEIVMLFGMQTLSMSIYRLVFQGVRDTGFLIIKGEMDQILTKPRNPLLVMSARRSNINGLGDLITGLVLIFIASGKIGYIWTFPKILQLSTFIISGNLIMIALFLIQGIFAFWIIRFNVLHEFLLTMMRFNTYPLKIFGPFIQAAMLVAVPIGFAVYVPVSVLLAKDGFNFTWFFAPLAVGIGLLALSIWFFHFGLRRYDSSGS